jgi:hypothetical protein
MVILAIMRQRFWLSTREGAVNSNRSCFNGWSLIPKLEEAASTGGTGGRLSSLFALDIDGSRRRLGASLLDGGALVTSGLSRRTVFTALPGWIGLSGCRSASQLSALEGPSDLALRLSPVGSVDLNSTVEQALVISHRGGSKPSTAKVVLVDVVQDDPTVDATALRWAAGYPVYDEVASTDTEIVVLVKFAVPAGIPSTGRARILFEL